MVIYDVKLDYIVLGVLGVGECGYFDILAFCFPYGVVLPL
jgi:hypothetical protein